MNIHFLSICSSFKFNISGCVLSDLLFIPSFCSFDHTYESLTNRKLVVPRLSFSFRLVGRSLTS